MASLEQLVTDLSGLTVIEAAELSKMLEERWGVSAAAPVAAAAAPPGVDGRRYALALCEDVIELVGDLSIVEPAVLTVPRGDPHWTADVSAVCWPGPS